MSPGQLLTFDDVNLAYSIGHFDVRVSQPQPPGYPRFVLEMRLLQWLHIRRAEHILLTLGVAASIAALALLMRLGNLMFGGEAGFYAASQEAFEQGAAPLRMSVPEGSRIVWLLNPRTEFYHLVQRAFAPAAAGPVYVTDLPPGSGSARSRSIC